MKAAVAKTMDGHSLNDDPAPGWYRELVARRSGDKVDAYYYPPDGTQLRSRPDVRRYFEAHPDEAKVGDRTSRRPAVLSTRVGSTRRGRVRETAFMKMAPSRPRCAAQARWTPRATSSSPTRKCRRPRLVDASRWTGPRFPKNYVDYGTRCPMIRGRFMIRKLMN